MCVCLYLCMYVCIYASPPPPVGWGGCSMSVPTWVGRYRHVCMCVFVYVCM